MRFEPFVYQLHKAWVDKVIKCTYTDHTRGIMAIRDDGSIAGAIIMTNWAPNSVHIHVGAETALVWKYGLHIEAAEYIFHKCGKDIVLGLTPADNEIALKFNRKMGLREVGRIPNGYKRGTDFVFQMMRRDECSYLENEE